MENDSTIKWVGISGSWRKTNKEVENDVREVVRDIIKGGNGIVTGGALNVDYFATDEALKLDPEATCIKVCLPVTLKKYRRHYRKRANEGVIAHWQAEKLISQLANLKKRNSNALIENLKNKVVNKDTYFERNSKVVEVSDEIIAFQVNESEGVQDTIDKARAEDKPVWVKEYYIE